MILKASQIDNVYLEPSEFIILFRDKRGYITFVCNTNVIGADMNLDMISRSGGQVMCWDLNGRMEKKGPRYVILWNYTKKQVRVGIKFTEW